MRIYHSPYRCQLFGAAIKLLDSFLEYERTFDTNSLIVPDTSKKFTMSLAK
jgi:hypothetical protein